jgi:hypothetical protein
MDSCIFLNNSSMKSNSTFSARPTSVSRRLYYTALSRRLFLPPLLDSCVPTAKQTKVSFFMIFFLTWKNAFQGGASPKKCILLNFRTSLSFSYLRWETKVELQSGWPDWANLAYRAIVYFGRFFNYTRRPIFSTVKVLQLFWQKMGWATLWAFWQTHLVTLATM